jgi:hypothetical protein
MLEAYFDESESEGKKVFVLAGWAAPAETWREFEVAWKATLDAFGLRCFHSVDSAHRKREFAGWATERQRNLMNALVGALESRPMLGLSLRINLEDYDRLTKVHGPRWHRPYFLALWHCTVCVAEIARHFGEPDTTFVFAHQPEWSGRVPGHYGRMKDLNELYGTGSYGALRIDMPAQTPGLQAADLLAYESVLQEYRRRYGSARPPRVAMERLREKVSVRLLDEAGLLEAMAIQ